MTVVAAGVIAANAGRPDLVFAALIRSGVLQVVLGLLQAGRLIRYIPFPVISGLVSGIGVIIVALQLAPLFGASGSGDVLKAVSNIFSLPGRANLSALAMGVGSLAIIYGLGRLALRLPAPLIALALALATGVSVL